MPDVQTTADRVMMRFGEIIEDALGAADIAEDIAAALSSHGLREAVDTLELYGKQKIGGGEARHAVATLLGEGDV